MAVPAIPLAVDDLIRCKIVTQCDNQAGLMILHFRVTSNDIPVATDLSDVLGTFAGVFAGPMKAVMSERARYAGLTLARNRGIWTAEYFSAVGQGFGLVAGDTLPKQICGVVSKRVAVAGHGKTGRSYVPFPGEVSNSAIAAPTGAYMTLLSAVKDAIVSQIDYVVAPNRMVFTPIVYKKLSPGTSAVVVDGIARGVWGTQRRRGDFGRVNLAPS